MSARRGLVALGACFFLSGLGSLALEVVWTRQMRLVFGSTTLAASTILVAYMLGLGIGGLVGGRVAGRLRDGVRTYGLLEIAIGVYALAVPWLLLQLPELNRTLLAGMAFWPAALCRFAIALVLLLVPTVLMGATLPIVVAALVRRDPRIGASTGLLYGLNTLGAVAGVFLATFAFFPLLGLRWTNVLGALVDVAVGVVALVLVAPAVRAWQTSPGARDAGTIPADAPGTERMAALRSTDAAVPSPVPLAVTLGVYGVVGFSALLYEVAWTRALAVVLGSSIYAFSSMLGSFLTGIALGSLLFRRWVDATRAPHLLLAGGIALLAVLGLATSLVMPYLPDVFLDYFATPDHAPYRLLLVQVGLSMLAMLPPTLVLGGLFPLVARLVASAGRDPGDAVGKVYFANTVGSATGAFVTGFALIPWIGVRDTLALGAALDLAAAGVLLLLCARGPRRVAVRAAAGAAFAACALLAVVPIPFDREAFTRGVFKSPDLALDFGVEYLPLEGVRDRELLFYADGINATVSVHRGGATTFLRVNGKPDASSRDDMPTQVMLGEVPLLFGPPAENVLVIGYASGVTVGSVARHPEVKRIDAVEIEPAIAAASRFFDAQSGAPLDDPRVRLVLDDARAYLAAPPVRYDVIISEPSNPWMSGVSNLFTREFFQIVRGALAPGGRLLQWVQLYAMDPASLYSILAAIRSEFRHVYGFANEQGGADLLLLAQDEPLERDDLPRWEDLAPQVRLDLERVGTHSTTDLWSLVRLLPADVDALVAEAPGVNADDNLMIELATPLMLHEDTLTPNWEAFERFPRGIVPLLEASGEPLDAPAAGALALSYLARRTDPVVGPEVLRFAQGRGASAGAVLGSLFLGRSSNVDGTFTVEQQIAVADAALALDPRSFDAHLLRAEILLEAERHAEALAAADAALLLRPGDPRALRPRADALVALGRDEEALVAIRAVRASPAATPQEDLGQREAELAVRTGRTAEAKDALERELHGEDPTWLEGWLMLAELRAATGDDDGAAAARRNAQRTLENRARAYQWLARGALWRGAPDEALPLLETAAQAAPHDALIAADLAAVRARLAAQVGS